VAGHQAPVPADHGRRFHDQHHPLEAPPVKGPGQHRENGSVGGSETRPLNLSSQNKDLMAEGEDLRVFAITTYQKQPDTGNQKPGQVRKDRGHSQSKYRTRTL
jgi:hypothetical protein